MCPVGVGHGGGGGGGGGSGQIAAVRGSEYPRTGIDVLNALATQPGTLAAYLFSLEGRIAQYTGSVGGSEHGVIDTINYLNQVNFIGPVNLAKVSLPDNIAVDSITPPSGTLTIILPPVTGALTIEKGTLNVPTIIAGNIQVNGINSVSQPLTILGDLIVNGTEEVHNTDTLLGLLTVNVPSFGNIASFEVAGSQVSFIDGFGEYNIGTTTYGDGGIATTRHGFEGFGLPDPISVGTYLILTASGLTTPQVFTFPNLTDTITTLTAVQTLTNKTLSSPFLSGTIGGTYTIGGAPTLGASLILNGQALAGPASFTGNIVFTLIPSLNAGVLTGGGGTAPTVVSPTSTSPFIPSSTVNTVLTVSGGVVSVISINGITTGLTSGTFYMKAGDYITITFSSLPLVLQMRA